GVVARRHRQLVEVDEERPGHAALVRDCGGAHHAARRQGGPGGRSSPAKRGDKLRIPPGSWDAPKERATRGKGGPHFGGIRSAPSRRITSPLIMGFSTIWRTSAA